MSYCDKLFWTPIPKISLFHVSGPQNILTVTLKSAKKSVLSRVGAECFREISLKLQEFEEHFELLFFQ